MTLSSRILLRRERESSYTVTVPSLLGCVTFGNTKEDAIKIAKETIEVYIESLREHNEKYYLKKSHENTVMGAHV